MDYLALSHCWGGPATDEGKKYCTTPENIPRRLNGFTYEDMPKTFQDAVQVTRKLGKHFLWIDSHCIIQEEEGKIDWERESKLMEQVFSSAYCTIAATSATGWKEGFLERESTIQSVRVQRRLWECGEGVVPLRPPISPLANGATPLANKVPLPDGGSPLANFLEL